LQPAKILEESSASNNMDKSEAEKKAREVLRSITGVDAAADSIEFKSVGGRRRWTVFFGRDHFVAQRVAIDGEGYTLVVNDTTGEVHIFGPLHT
jgi:hypothetical protein